MEGGQPTVNHPSINIIILLLRLKRERTLIHQQLDKSKVTLFRCITDGLTDRLTDWVATENHNCELFLKNWVSQVPCTSVWCCSKLEEINKGRGLQVARAGHGSNRGRKLPVSRRLELARARSPTPTTSNVLNKQERGVTGGLACRGR